MTQQELILEKLNKGGWTCSTELIDLYSVDYRSQINKLRKKGYDIRAEPCDGFCGRKHSSRMNRWYLQLYNFNGEPINVPLASKDNHTIYRPVDDRVRQETGQGILPV